MYELEDKDLETLLKLVPDNCREVLVALQKTGRPDKQWGAITTLLMHTSELRREFLKILTTIAKEHPDAISEQQKKIWLGKKE
ncbi:hypothetical protein HY625_01100 [Candidatus Uhrbacteria bacterium]|nr:hypothetical protein [Candidatus Uhrbacteria bacterium]